MAVVVKSKRTIQRNTFLLALLLLPKLRESAAKFNIVPRLVIVSSELHEITSFPERNSPDIFGALNDKSNAIMRDRSVTSFLPLPRRPSMTSVGAS